MDIIEAYDAIDYILINLNILDLLPLNMNLRRGEYALFDSDEIIFTIIVVPLDIGLNIPAKYGSQNDQ